MTLNLFDPNLAAQAQAAPVAQPVVAFHGLGDDAWLAASQALAPDAPVEVPGLVRPFHPWQSAAYLFAQQSIARWGGCLIGDDMGLGKTAVLLALASERVRLTGRPAIMVSPPVAEGGYITELAACFPSLRLCIVKGHKRLPLPQADIFFVSDDSRTMQTWLTDETVDAQGRKHLVASAWAQSASIITRDEIHRDKGNGKNPTGRSRVMLALGKHCRTVGTPIVAATGTLLTNRPVEAYIPLQIVGGEDLVKAVTPGAKNMTSYLWRYCSPVQGVGRGGRQYTSFGGIDTKEAMQLHEYLRRTAYVRREKSDLAEGVLPHSGWVIVPATLPDATMRRYQRLEKDFLGLITEERGKVWADRVSRAQAVVQMGMLREEAGIAKAGFAADYIANLVGDGKQVVAFYEHTQAWEKLSLALLNKGLSIVSINGKVTGDDRIEAIEDFQSGRANVCLANIKAAGMAVTLTAASDAVFVQVPWSAGDLKQAADRILRVDDITAARAAAGERVTWHVLQAHYSDGDATFDAAIWTVLERKAAVCDAVNAGRPVTMSSESVQYEALMEWVPSKRHTVW
jgi:Helicase conserved C-terminal domain